MNSEGSTILLHTTDGNILVRQKKLNNEIFYSESYMNNEIFYSSLICFSIGLIIGLSIKSKS